ncbi:uncharacterized protein THITE_2125046 [Thermothielavioides terrestris NRRL 8126]|uniref:Uncharacterized protein n=1 Tax=Thermothielavioides terrestris (strain ATCC 38088 / NRRL 8126) TaxID=578455 RepID=G2QXQ0_THETT|nr:uncharacterized protein THITE_2125046 [Thermothielavioides terrestris NRRL 8126]AEO62368.1 hypothetical protein THITE_2125046 [Thermothielavioides terrestris NRRL 8126]
MGDPQWTEHVPQHYMAVSRKPADEHGVADRRRPNPELHASDVLQIRCLKETELACHARVLQTPIAVFRRLALSAQNSATDLDGRMEDRMFALTSICSRAGSSSLLATLSDVQHPLALALQRNTAGPLDRRDFAVSRKAEAFGIPRKAGF